jgi:hypothetical protein
MLVSSDGKILAYAASDMSVGVINAKTLAVRMCG